MVMSIERSPRSAMSAQTSSIPSIQGASATTSATSSAVRSAHSAWVSTAKSAAEISSVANCRSSSASGSRRPTRREISIAAVVPRSSVPSMSNTCRALIASPRYPRPDPDRNRCERGRHDHHASTHISRGCPQLGGHRRSRTRRPRRSSTAGCSAGRSPPSRLPVPRSTPSPRWTAATSRASARPTTVRRRGTRTSRSTTPEAAAARISDAGGEVTDDPGELGPFGPVGEPAGPGGRPVPPVAGRRALRGSGRQ